MSQTFLCSSGIGKVVGENVEVKITRCVVNALLRINIKLYIRHCEFTEVAGYGWITEVQLTAKAGAFLHATTFTPTTKSTQLTVHFIPEVHSRR
jgi:hypothetical protein